MDTPAPAQTGSGRAPRVDHTAELQKQIEQYQKEYDLTDDLGKSIDADRADAEFDALDEEEDDNNEPDIDEQEVQKKIESAKKQTQRKRMFGPGADEIYGGKEADPDEFDRELGLARKKSKKGTPRNKMPADVAKKLGEANMLYAMKDLPKAVSLLHEVIRKAPNEPTPYQTLALIYEETGDFKKALEFYMIAAHILVKDVELWKRVGKLSRDQSLYRQAAYCYAKAVRFDPADAEAHWERAVLYGLMGEHRRSLECMLTCLKLSPGDQFLMQEISRVYHTLGQTEKAQSLLESCFEKMTELDMNLANMLAELYIGSKQYEKAARVISRVQAMLPAGQQLPLDLQVHLGVCHAHLDNLPAANVLFDHLLQKSVQSYADAYMDVADALSDVGAHVRALVFLDALMQHPDYNNPAVWLRRANAHRAIGEVDTAQKEYNDVLASSPGSVDACLALCEIWNDKGEPERALEVLASHKLSEEEQKSGAHAISPALPDKDLNVVIQHALLLHALNKFEQFLDLVVPVMKAEAAALPAAEATEAAEDNHSTPRRKRKKTAASGADGADDADGILELPPRRKRAAAAAAVQDPEQQQQQQQLADENGDGGENGADAAEKANKRAPPTLAQLLGEEEYFELVVKVCRVLVQFRRFADAAQIVNGVLNNVKFQSKHKDQLKFLAVGLAFNNADYTLAYESVRYVCTQRPYSIIIWNLFNKITTKKGDFSSNQKFMIRLLLRYPNSVPLMLLVGHYAMMSSRYQLALDQYLRAYAAVPQSPLTSLFIGLGYLHLSTNRKQPDRHYLVIQAFTFLYNYWRLKDGNAEANYNMARAYHQLGLVHFAVPYYEKVLYATEDAAAEGLHREAAYNLALIYRASGNLPLAMQISRKYLTI